MRVGDHLCIVQLPDLHGRKTHRWAIYPRQGTRLGTVTWYAPWRQYTFDPEPNTTYSAGCLSDLAAWIKGL